MWMALALWGCTAATTETEESDTEATETEATETEATESETDGGVQVLMSTTLGDITLVLDEENAPITVENFLVYVDEGFYDGDDELGATIFHRVVEGFVVQGGGYTADGTTKSVHDAIELESDNGLSNLRGTIAMARRTPPNTATSQFYFNTVDNTGLDYTSSSDGYAVFGEVIDGMDVVDAIEAVSVDGADQPVEDVLITDCERL